MIKVIEEFDQGIQARVLAAIAYSGKLSDIESARYLLQQTNTFAMRRWKCLAWHKFRDYSSSYEEDECEYFLEQLNPAQYLDFQLSQLITEENERSMIEAGLAADLSEKEALAEVARAYLLAPIRVRQSDLELSRWLHENAAEIDLEAEVEDRLKRWEGRSWGRIEENPQASRMALNIFRKNFAAARAEFDLLLGRAPEHVPYFLEHIQMPEDLRREFKSRVSKLE